MEKNKKVNEKEIDSINESIQIRLRIEWHTCTLKTVLLFCAYKWNMAGAIQNRAIYWLIVSNDINSIKTSVLFSALQQQLAKKKEKNIAHTHVS